MQLFNWNIYWKCTKSWFAIVGKAFICSFVLCFIILASIIAFPFRFGMTFWNLLAFRCIRRICVRDTLQWTFLTFVQSFCTTHHSPNTYFWPTDWMQGLSVAWRIQETTFELRWCELLRFDLCELSHLKPFETSMIEWENSIDRVKFPAQTAKLIECGFINHWLSNFFSDSPKVTNSTYSMNNLQFPNTFVALCVFCKRRHWKIANRIVLLLMNFSFNLK